MQKRTAVVDLGELVQDVVDGVVLGHSATQMPVEIATTPDPKRRANEVVILVDIQPSVNWRFETEVGGWKRIVMNLLGNSLKYTDHGQIKVRLFLIDTLAEKPPGTEMGKHICIQVSDTGRGMSADYLRHGLFKPFVQENNLSTGTGLGLSIVQRLVESLNGTIDVQSKLGVGTRTEILIPIGGKTQLARDKPSTGNRNSGSNMDPEGSLRGRTLFLPPVSTAGLSKDLSVQTGAAPQSPDSAVRGLLASIAQDWLYMKVVENIQADSSNDGGGTDVFTLLLSVQSDGSLGSDWTLRTPLLPNKGLNTQKDASRVPIFAEKIILSPFSPRNVARAFLDARHPKTARKSETNTLNARILQQPIERGASVISEAPKTSMSEGSLGDPTEIVTYNILDRTVQGTLSHTKTDHQNHVLIVDDNPINLNILSKVVQNVGCSFVRALDGRQAVEAFTMTTRPFDLILMDLSMPVMDGFTATRQIRAHELSIHGLSRRTRIVALTALGSAASKDKAFASGIDSKRASACEI
jgi:CheY-like chemotaxis protein